MGDPVTRWMASNVAAPKDGRATSSPPRSTERIDGIVAMIMVIGRAMIAREQFVATSLAVWA